MLRKILIKDLKLLMAERKSLMIFFLMPIVLTTILSLALQGSFSSETPVTTIHIAIVKDYDLEDDLALMQDKFDVDFQTLAQDDGQTLDLESMFFDDFLGDPSLTKMLDYQIMNKDTAILELENQKIDAVVTLPDRYIYNQMVNYFTPYRNEMTIEITGRADQQFATKMVYDIMTMYFDANNLKMVQKNAFLKTAVPKLGIEGSMTYIEGIMNLNTRTASIAEDEIPGYKTMTSFTYYAIGMMAMFVLYAASFSGKALLREKQTHTLDRNTISGVTYQKMLFSKFLMTGVLVFVQVACLLTYSGLVLKVGWTLRPELLLAMVFTAIAISGFGSLISALAMYYDNPNIPAIFENVIIHIFALVGGSYIPVEVLPLQVAILKVIAVNGMVLDLFIKVYQEATILTMLPQLLMLLAFSVITFTLGVLLISRKESSVRA